MKCPNCGEDVTDDVPFCPHCGHNLEGRRHKRKLRFILMDVQDDMRFRHLASAAVITVVIVAVISVLLALGTPADDQGSVDTPGYGEPSDGAIIVSDTSFIELSRAFDDGDMSARLDSSGQLSIWLSDGASEGFSAFTWILRDEYSNTSQAITKDTADLTWVSPDLGRYTVTVHCIADDGSEAVYVGMIDYLGNSHVQYSFVHDGESYSVYVDVSLDEFLGCINADGVPDDRRHSPTAESGAAFNDTGGSVELLSERLRNAYLSHNPGASTSGQEYEDYILDFVQSCFTVGSDTYYHSTSTYWAFPAETLYTSVGDSGDLAVLAASILIASGYDAGIAVVNGHGFVAVSLDSYTGPSSVPEGYHQLRVSQNGTSYYITEVDERDVPLGYVDESYGYSGGRFTYYGQAAGEGSGIALP